MTVVRSVLVVEDDPVSRAYLQTVLAALPAEVTAAAGAVEALAATQRSRFDLLVLDLSLPDGDGAGLLAAIRADPGSASQQAPALALTAELDAVRRARLLAQGFAAAARKPIAAAALQQQVRELLSRRHHSRAACWDDASAASATGGREDLVRELRALLRRDLPEQRDAIASAISRGDPHGARDTLHRLRAACGFCGAVELGITVGELGDVLAIGTDPAAAQAAFDAACGRVLQPD